MTMTQANPVSLWQRVVESHQHYAQAFSEFLAGSPEKIDVLRSALRGKDRVLALSVVPSLTMDEKKALLPEWVHLARAAHSPFQIAWNIIESLPREFVLENLPREVDAILLTGEETDYWMFLQLYARLDRSLRDNLALRAAKHDDPDIRELAKEFTPPDESIAELNLSVRAQKCLNRLGITSVGELVKRSEDELLTEKNFGMTSLKEVREKLGRIGKELKKKD